MAGHPLCAPAGFASVDRCPDEGTKFFTFDQPATSTEPPVLFRGLRPGYGFLRSKLNPSDDRTRGVSLRGPCRSASPWFSEFQDGNLTALDCALRDFGLSIDDLRGLPDPGLSLAFLATSTLDPLLPLKQSLFPADWTLLPFRTAPLSHVPKNPLRLLPCAQAPACAGAPSLSSPAIHHSFCDLSAAFAWARGWVDLFSGSRGLARALVDVGAVPWALCWDTRHCASEDLLDERVKTLIESLLDGGPLWVFQEDLFVLVSLLL